MLNFKVLFNLSMLSFVSIFSLKAQNISNEACREVLPVYRRLAELIPKLYAEGKHKEEDSLTIESIAIIESKCPCTYAYALRIRRWAFLHFYMLNNPNRAFEILEEKKKKCIGVNDSTTLLFLLEKAVLHLRNDDFINMKRSLDEALDFGSTKFKGNYPDLVRTKANLAIYYNWKNDLESSTNILIENELNIENEIVIDTMLRIQCIENVISNALYLGKKEILETYKRKLDSIVENTKYSKNSKIRVDEIYFNYSLSKKDYVLAERFYKNLPYENSIDYLGGIPIVNFLISLGKLDSAISKISKIDSVLNARQVPLHHFYRINVDMQKIKIPNFLKNEPDLYHKILISLNNNYINLINESPSIQSKNALFLTSKFISLITTMIKNNDQRFISEAYSYLNRLKNTSNLYYKKLHEFIKQSDDIELKLYYQTYKDLCATMLKHRTSRVFLDSINIIDRKIHNKLLDAKIRWHSINSNEDIQQNLEIGEVFLDFYENQDPLSGDQLIVFISTKDTTVFFRYDNLRENMERQWKASNYTNNSQKNKALYDYLIAPIDVYIKNNKKLYVSTDGELNQVAIDLLSPTGKKNNILSDLYEILFIENANSLRKIYNVKPNKEIDNYAIMGGIRYDCNSFLSESENNLSNTITTRNDIGYLQGSYKEIEIIKDKLKAKGMSTMVYKNCEATKLKLIEVLKDPKVDIVHISTHGFVNNAVSTTVQNYFTYNSNSSILLARDAKYDSPEYTAIEILNNDLSEKGLVFLSACNTGRGKFLPGYGNTSVANAFKKAGVNKVIATLWPIPDDISVELCEHFYSHFIISKDANQALKYAKNQLRNKYSPQHWGAFRVLN